MVGRWGYSGTIVTGRCEDLSGFGICDLKTFLGLEIFW